MAGPNSFTIASFVTGSSKVSDLIGIMSLIRKYIIFFNTGPVNFEIKLFYFSHALEHLEGIKLDTKIQPWDERKRDLEEAEEAERQEQARIAQEAARNRRPETEVQPPDAKRRRREEDSDPQGIQCENV